MIRTMIPAILFATGTENSIPTLHQGQVRIAQMEKCGHYEQWRVDIDLYNVFFEPDLTEEKSDDLTQSLKSL